jgi:hypothetical protein
MVMVGEGASDVCRPVEPVQATAGRSVAHNRVRAVDRCLDICTGDLLVAAFCVE